MRLALLIVLAGCGTAVQSPYFCQTPCGLHIAAANHQPQFSCEDYAKLERAMVETIPLPICRAVKNQLAWEMPGFSSKIGTANAAGWTECHYNRFSFHTGNGYLFKDDYSRTRAVWQTAFAHEAVHMAQNCEAPLPVDEGWDEGHANWVRDGLFNAVEWANRRASEAP